MRSASRKDSEALVKKSDENQKTLTMVQFYNALNKYIPSLVLQSWMQTAANKQILKKEFELPYIQQLETVVLFADISGFTKVGEACAAHGIRGNEELAFVINKYMEALVKHLAKYGGDIIKFVGDAMIVMWPRASKNKVVGKDDEGDPESETIQQDERINIIRKSIQCAWDIQKELDNKKIMEGVTNLSVKIGIGYGKCALLYVGGVFGRSEYFTVGPALSHALNSEGEATAGGQIIVSETAYRFVRNFYEAAEIESDHGRKYYRVSKVKEGVRGRADAILLKSQFKMEQMEAMKKQLKSCVPAAIMPYLEIGHEQFGSETRALTVMFASLGVELSSANTPEGMDKIQKIVQTVQKNVYRGQGSLNKLVMDDKGSTLICIWGVCPMAHYDDTTRAIITAFNMKKALQKIDNTWINCGIATGDVFSGVVGTQGSRKEFSCLGDVVNLAARIMAWPKMHGQKGKINTCERTKNEAFNNISFNYGGHCEFKGKSIAIPIFAPIDPEEEFKITKRMIPPQAYLKWSYNPMIVERSVKHAKHQHNRAYIDRIGQVNQIHRDIKDFFVRHTQNKGATTPLNMIIQGEIGSGKTHLCRAVCEKLQNDPDLMYNLQKQYINKGAYTSNDKSKILSHSYSKISQHRNIESKAHKITIFSSAMNVEQKFKFLGAWRHILRNMFEFMKVHLDLQTKEMLEKIIGDQYDKVALVLDIFGFATDDGQSEQYNEYRILLQTLMKEQTDQVENLNKHKMIGFLCRDEYGDQVTDKVLEMILAFIVEFLGEESDQSSYQSKASIDLSEESQKNKKKRAKSPQGSNHLIALLIFDNASLMDPESWSLLLRVYTYCQKVMILMCLQQDHKGNAIYPELEKIKRKPQGEVNINDIPPYNIDDVHLVKDFVQQGIYYDVPHFSVKLLKRVLIDLSGQYVESYMDEVILKTTIKPKENANDHNEAQRKAMEWRKIFSDKFLLEKQFTDVEDEILELIVTKSEGNALICLQMFINLLQNGFLEINKKGAVTVTEVFKKCKRLNNWTKLPVPSSVLKRRMTNLDKPIYNIRTSQNKNKIELATKGSLVLKTACVIGEEFGTQALKKMLPLRGESHVSLLKILKYLEEQEFIEVLNESDPKDIHCRFNKSFLRESIYQVMLYKDQKQTLSKAYAEYLQSLPISNIEDKQIEFDHETLKDTIMIAEDQKNEDNMPFILLQGLIVKEMQVKLLKSNNKTILHKGWVLKQGHQANAKVSKRLFILTTKDLQWYHNHKEYEEGMNPLGRIKIEHIYACQESIMQAETFDFDIFVSQFVKKGTLIETPNKFAFGAEKDVDRYNWIARIEFMRAKTVYENYITKFVEIQFPLRKPEDVEDDSELHREALFEKLDHFGKQFKQNARINTNIIDRKTAKPATTRATFQSSKNVSSSNNYPPRNSTTLGKFQDFMLDDGSNGDYPQNQNVHDMKDKLKQLYGASMVSLITHTSIQANKSSNGGLKSQPLGRMPEFYYPSENLLGYKFLNYGSNSDNQSQKSRVTSRRMSFQQNMLPQLKKGKSEQVELKPRGSEQLPPKQDRIAIELQRKSDQNTPDPIDQISEKDEGSSSSSNSNYNRQNTKKLSNQQYPLQKQRSSVQIQSDNKSPLIELQREKSQEPIIRNEEKVDSNGNTISGNSGARVSIQLKMLEESKIDHNSKPEEKKTKMSTKHPSSKQHSRQQSYGHLDMLSQNALQDQSRKFTFQQMQPIDNSRQRLNEVPSKKSQFPAQHERNFSNGNDKTIQDLQNQIQVNDRSYHPFDKMTDQEFQRVDNQFLQQRYPQNMDQQFQQDIGQFDIDGVSSINGGGQLQEMPSYPRTQYNYQQSQSPLLDERMHQRNPSNLTTSRIMNGNNNIGFEHRHPQLGQQLQQEYSQNQFQQMTSQEQYTQALNNMRPPQQVITPQIEQEINRQINAGLQEFFKNLDQKLINNSHIEMDKIFDRSTVMDQQNGPPSMIQHSQSPIDTRHLRPIQHSNTAVKVNHMQLTPPPSDLRLVPQNLSMGSVQTSDPQIKFTQQQRLQNPHISSITETIRSSAQFLDGRVSKQGGGVAAKKRGQIMTESSVQSKKSDSDNEPDDPFLENDEIKRKYRKQKRRIPGNNEV